VTVVTKDGETNSRSVYYLRRYLKVFSMYKGGEYPHWVAWG
jgi:hypothetical protein